MQAPQFQPNPQQIAAALFRASKPKNDPLSFRDRVDTLAYVTKATTSLPVITIATRDRVEVEMVGRRQAQQNFVDMVSDTSPEPLDA